MLHALWGLGICLGDDAGCMMAAPPWCGWLMAGSPLHHLCSLDCPYIHHARLHAQIRGTAAQQLAPAAGSSQARGNPGAAALQACTPLPGPPVCELGYMRRRAGRGKDS